jgi:hypothetical protein
MMSRLLPSTRKFVGFIALVTTTLLFSSLLGAQTWTTGAISGVVTDPSGAVIPGASVRVTSVSTGAGYWNVEVNGLPATSNNFAIDGLNANDPFLNVNNSGATNLQLGANDVNEATVLTNGYGGLAGTAANLQPRRRDEDPF